MIRLEPPEFDLRDTRLHDCNCHIVHILFDPIFISLYVSFEIASEDIAVVILTMSTNVVYVPTILSKFDPLVQ